MTHMRWQYIIAALLVLAVGACSKRVPLVRRGSVNCPFGKPVFKCPTQPCTAPILVKRDQYTLAYWPTTRTPLWVCESIDPKELVGNAKRIASFKIDPQVPRSYQTGSLAYLKQGYDKGHMAPAANQEWNQTYQNETFYMTNMAPQLPRFNRGIWKGLETWVRSWVSKRGFAYVISGPLFLGKPRLMGSVRVPSHFFKVVVSKRGTKTWHVLAFVLNHRDYGKAPYKWTPFVRSVRWVEKRTHLDLLPHLRKGRSLKLETKAANFKLWRLQ